MPYLEYLLFAMPWLFILAALYALFSITGELRAIRRALESERALASRGTGRAI
jgi:hypothetical protein